MNCFAVKGFKPAVAKADARKTVVAKVCSMLITTISGVL
jgi:hypothetical protein